MSSATAEPHFTPVPGTETSRPMASEAHRAADADRLPRALIVSMMALTAAPLGLALFVEFHALPRGVGSRLHGLIEWTSVGVSFFTAYLGFVYLFARRDVLVTTIAVASLAAGIWDAAHTVASVGLVGVASSLHDFIPLSSAASRSLRALILAIGVSLLLARSTKAIEIGWKTVSFICALVAAAAYGFYAMSLGATLPRAYFPDDLVSRPWDLAALGLYLVLGMVLCPLLLMRAPSLLAKALQLSMVPEILACVVMAFGSTSLFDGPFFIAHALKVIGGVAPLAGICLHLVRSYRREIGSAASMEKLVTNLRSVEADLRSKELRLDQLTNNIKEVFWISAPNGGGLHYVSPAYEEIFGLSCESLYQDPSSFLQVVHPNDRNSLASLLSASPGGDFELDYRIVRSDGEIRWLRTRGFPFRDDQGVVYRLVGVTEDVTARKQAEQELKRNEARTRALLRAMPDLMFRVSRSGTILDYHPGSATRLYKPPSAFLGARFSDILPELGDQFLHHIEEALRTGVVQSMGYRLEIAGHMGEYEARFAPSDDEVLMVVRDVTDQYRLQREILDISHREQERIGHDLHDGISQRLAGIALLTKALQQRLARKLQVEADRALQIAQLVDETLTQTKSLARGLAPVELEGGGLSSALEDLAHGIETIHGIRCRYRCERDCDVADHATAIHVYRIAQEAVSNALRHAAPSRIAIDLSVSNGWRRLSVSDDGRGMPEEASRSTTGMGLSIMRYRSRMIEGSLEVRSGPDRGTVVTCEWPAEVGVPANRPSQGRRAAPKRKR